VGLGLVGSDQPLLSVLADLAVGVGEGAQGPEVQGDLVGQDDGVHQVNDLLVDPGEVGTGLGDDPLLSGHALLAVTRHAVQAGPEPQSLVGADDGGHSGLHDLDGHVGEVSAGTLKEPLVTSAALDAVHLHVANGAQAEGAVGLDHSQGGDVHHKGLARVKGEGLLQKSRTRTKMTRREE